MPEIDQPEKRQTIRTTPIHGLLEIERPVFPDDRGSFQELFRKSELEAAVGHDIVYEQGNISVTDPGWFRGLHIACYPKQTRVYFGRVLATILDTRPCSPTYGKGYVTELSLKTPKSLWVPAYCANGFLALGEEIDQTVLEGLPPEIRRLVQLTVYGYLVGKEYDKSLEIGLAWDDPKVRLQIALPGTAKVFGKDNSNPSWDEALKAAGERWGQDFEKAK